MEEAQASPWHQAVVCNVYICIFSHSKHFIFNNTPLTFAFKTTPLSSQAPESVLFPVVFERSISSSNGRAKRPKRDHNCTNCSNAPSRGKSSCAAHFKRRSDWKSNLRLAARFGQSVLILKKSPLETQRPEFTFGKYPKQNMTTRVRSATLKGLGPTLKKPPANCMRMQGKPFKNLNIFPSTKSCWHIGNIYGARKKCFFPLRFCERINFR